MKLPVRSEKLNHGVISYLMGFSVILLALAVFAGVVHHLTLSHRGPGLLRPILIEHQTRNKSEIVHQAKHLEELERHRHFHNVLPPFPKLPAKLQPVCSICHSDFPHSKNKRIRSLMNLHTQFLVCETCHLKEQPGIQVSYYWYNPQDETPEGPFYGTSFEPETGSLSKGKDLLSKIVPFIRNGKASTTKPATENQSTPMAADFIKVRNKLSPEQREGIKNKFHDKIRPKGHTCKECHTENGLLNFKQLGFSQNRTENLIKLDIVGMLTKYDTFYLPELFSDPKTTGKVFE